MKRFLVTSLCCLLVCLQIVPCFAISADIDLQIEMNEDGSFFIVCDDLRDICIPGLPELDDELHDLGMSSSGIAGIPDSSGISSEGSINAFVKLFNKIIEAFMRLIMQFTNQKEITKKKYIYYYSSESKLLWSGVLNGEFLYSSTSAQCVNASFDFETFDSNWNLIDYTCKSEAATASVTFYVSQKSLGVKLQAIEKTLTLTCDTNGNVT